MIEMPVFLFVFIVMLVLTLFARDIPVEVTADADIVKNTGGFKVRVCGIPVYTGQFHAESKDPAHNNLVIEHKKQRAEVHLNADKKDKRSVASYLSSPLLSAIRIKNVNVSIRLGLAHDPFVTTMAFGAARIVLYAVLGFIKSRFQAEIKEDFEPDYYADRLDFAAYAKIHISLGGIIYGLILTAGISLRNLGKRRKQARLPAAGNGKA